MILTNSVVVSVIVLCILCMLKLNVILSLIISAIIGGLLSGMPLINLDPTDKLSKPFINLPFIGVEGDDIIGTFLNGMGSMSETALSYILIGAFAYAIGKSGLVTILAKKIANAVTNKKFAFIFIIAFVACFSQNLLPVHIAFIPILIPPLLVVMNKLKIDRRAVACALTFGLKAPYVSIPFGFGLIFHKLIAENMTKYGMEVNVSDTAHVMWIGGLSMLVGLIFCVLILYRKPREYKDIVAEGLPSLDEEVEFSSRAIGALIAAIAMLIVQIITKSLIPSALVGLLFMIITRAVKWNEINEMIDGGLKMMAFIAIVMFVAGGYGNVLDTGGGVTELVNSVGGFMSGGNLVLSSLVMLLIGLLITIGIGTSFGTIPIIASIYVPLAAQLGFSIPATILLIGVAAALGDAGSPASDSTLGPTSGLNADGQHDHIWDTCVPTFIAYDIFLVIGGILGAVILS